ncbi:transcriptional regulator, ArsR family domain protein [Rhodococcus sp. MTM3W5.2]|nr:transcriptional regulator, ArsR family domain protein [Rhodococcus sp. MTM3W5.2]
MPGRRSRRPPPPRGIGVQDPQPAVGAVMSWHARAGVLGVEHRVGHQLAHVVVLEPIEHCRALAARPHQTRHPQLRQVLRHRRRRLADVHRQLVDRAFPVDQGPQHAHPGGVRQHAEHLHDQVDLVVVQPPPASCIICIHTQIIRPDRPNMSDGQTRCAGL